MLAANSGPLSISWSRHQRTTIDGTQQWATGGPPVNLVGYWRWATGGPIEKLIIGCRQWATEGQSENRIVGYQRWTTAYQPVTPTAGHRLQPTSDRQLCRQWASGGPTESCYLGKDVWLLRIVRWNTIVKGCMAKQTVSWNTTGRGSTQYCKTIQYSKLKHNQYRLHGHSLSVQTVSWNTIGKD